MLWPGRPPGLAYASDLTPLAAPQNDECARHASAPNRSVTALAYPSVMDDALIDVILGRIDGDASLSEGTTDLLLAACQGDDALSAALGGAHPRRPPGTADGRPAPEAASAYLASITVEGFRGVGRATTLELRPGRGLTVVAGRNGSGKSSFAEGLEALLTGSAARLDSYTVFRDGWRNLHQGDPARVSAEFHVEGSPGTTIVERKWAAGADLDEGTCTVQVAGEKVTGLDRLGWGHDVTQYPPFLAHSDLARLYNGKRSDLYDQLAGVLGLGDLTTAQDRLGARRRTLEAAAKSADEERKAIVDLLATLDDERAAPVRTYMASRAPDLDAVARMVTGTGATTTGGVIDGLRRLANLSAPDPAAADAAATRLRHAADRLVAVQGTAATRARSLADLLDRAVRLHDDHPDDAGCPVCGRAAAMDDAWRSHAIAEIGRLREEAEAAESAHTEADSALQHARGLLTPLPPVLSDPPDTGIETTELARAWSAWATAPGVHTDGPDGLRAVAGHLDTADDLASKAADVRKLAADELASREDRWAPAAERVAAWITQGRAAADAASTVKRLKDAESWLKAAHDDIRNERLRPIAERAQATWRTLRHESNVELGAIRLFGSKTQRRVVLDATVDGSESNALGVMSQGEVNALALSIFLPRATLPESPFRFVVIDDPVQAMDPAKVDGLARVLHQAAQTHQVVVFTHDDRLPNALRRLDLDAHIVQVQRRPGSIVDLSPAGDPMSRALSDARSVAHDAGVPVDIKQRVVPGQCRLALEATLTDITLRRELRAGRAQHEVDELLAEARTLHQKAALALLGDLDAGGRVFPRLAQLGQRHVDTFKNLKPGAHGRFTGSTADIVRDTQRLVEVLQDTFA